MKKIFIGIVIGLIISSVVFFILGNKSNNRIDEMNTSNITEVINNNENSTDNTNTNMNTTPQSDTTSNSVNYNKTPKRYCEVDGCYKEGTNKLEGITGEIEYYCYTHYQELLGFLNVILGN